jgi:hypothetical protein
MEAIADGEICLADGTVRAKAVVAKSLAHNAKNTGEEAKKCTNIPFTTFVDKECNKDEVCDRFSEGSTTCFAATQIMEPYTVHTDTKNHCIRFAGTGDLVVDTTATSKYRGKTAAGKSQDCVKDQFCNPHGDRDGTTGDTCILNTKLTSTQRVSDKATVGATRKAGTTAADKWCLAWDGGAAKCTDKEVCNPQATAQANVCIKATDMAAHGEVGKKDNTKECISNGAANAKCGAKTVCNYGAGTTGGAACLAHTLLLGSIADTDAWTAAAQHKQDGVKTKYCLASGVNGTYHSEVCVATADAKLEVCNPVASTLADTCIVKAEVLSHGEEYVAAVTGASAAPAKSWCLGKLAYKQCKAKEVCNEGAATDATSCIPVAETLATPSHRILGTDTAKDQKYCFGVDDADKCTLTQACNPNGIKGGTVEKAVCVTNDRLVAHAALAVPTTDVKTTKDICIGTGSTTLAAPNDTDATLNLMQCNYGTGAFIAPAVVLAPGAAQDAGTPTVKTCFGAATTADCAATNFCNPTGTDTASCDAKPADCTVANICIDPQAVIASDAEFEAGVSTICLKDDGSKAELCVAETKPFCDVENGECVAEQVVDDSTVDPGEEGEGSTTSSSGASTVSFVAASVAVMLST